MEENRPEKPEETGEPERPQSLMNHALGGFYDRFRNVPLKYFDIFIGLCIAAIVLVLAVGVLQARA